MYQYQNPGQLQGYVPFRADPPVVTQPEKKAIKKQLSHTFIYAIIHGTASFVMAQIFYEILLSTGYEMRYTDDGTTIVDWMYSLCASMPSIIMCISLFLINKSIRKESISSYLRTDKISAGYIMPVIMVVMFAYGVSLILQLLTISGFSLIDLSPIAEEYLTENDLTPAYLVQELLTTVILAPIAEELMFRGVIMSRIAKVSRRAAIFISALFFGMMHGNLLQTILGFIVGIVFAYADLKAESLIPSIIGHMFINGSATVSTFVEYFAGEDVSNTVWTVMIVLYLLVGSIAFLVMAFGRKIKMPEYNDYHKKRMPIMFTCVSLWILMVLYVGEIVLTFGPMTDKLRNS